MKRIKTVAILVARMTSSRLPGKALLPLHGRPLIQYTIDRVKQCSEVDEIVLATSKDASDLPLSQYCLQQGIDVHCGSLDNVALRVLHAAEKTHADIFLRVNGDSPWVDPVLLDQAAVAARSGQADLVTNICPRTYPKGISVEALKLTAFQRACTMICEQADKEHVTRFLYQHPDQFRIIHLDSGHAWGHLDCAVDTPKDLELAEKVARSMGACHWRYTTEEIVEFYAGLSDERGTLNEN